MRKKLEPPDPKRCQAITIEGGFMRLGGVRSMRRCDRQPVAILTEARKNKVDGKRGAMSVCEDCLVRATNQLGPKFFTITKVVT